MPACGLQGGSGAGGQDPAGPALHLSGASQPRACTLTHHLCALEKTSGSLAGLLSVPFLREFKTNQKHQDS